MMTQAAERCVECGEPAYAEFEWLTSRGPVETCFCRVCGESFWAKWKATPVGATLTIRAIRDDRR